MEAVTSNCAHIETRGIKACLYGFVAMLVYKDAYGSGTADSFWVGCADGRIRPAPKIL